MNMSTSVSHSTSTTSSSTSQQVKTVDPIFKKPARRQVALSPTFKVNPETQEKTQKVYEGTYNIWYNKWTGQKHKGRFEIGERAPTRINVEKDSGYTLADKRKQQNSTFKTYFCLQFARGCCYMGHKCEYMHRIPRLDDLEETMKDCFGRDRHRDERDDMNGVGCFNRENRTIYLGNLHPYDVADGERVIRRHFSPFGEIERINVIYGKAIAFVRYKKRANAEFAKEAMEHQALEAGEILNVRWANDDPNPRAQLEAKRKLEETFVSHYVAKKAKDVVEKKVPLQPDMKKMVETHPVYQQYYAYYQVQTLPPPQPPGQPQSPEAQLVPALPPTEAHSPAESAYSAHMNETPNHTLDSSPPRSESHGPVTPKVPQKTAPSLLVSGYESDDED